MTGRILQAAAIVGCWFAVAAGGPTAQTGDLVSIHVAVPGGGDGLSKDDFEVLIDGRVMPIVSLTPPPNPLTIVLLLDKSASMETYGGIDDEIRQSFVPALRPADRARIGGIANRLQLAPAFSSNPREVIDRGRTAVSFERREMVGPSPIWDAVDRALAVLEPEPGLRALILVTDGRATGNTLSVTSVADRAVYAGIVIDVLSESLPVVIRQTETTAARIRPGLPLEQIARATGGLIVPEDPTPAMQLPPPGPSITRFVDDLRGMYTLGVAPAGPPGSLHRIEVRVRRGGLTARARSAYRTR